MSQKTNLANEQLFRWIPEDPFGNGIMFSFVQEESQRRIAGTHNLSQSLVSRIYRRLQDLCWVDLEKRSILPFGGPGAVIKCDESKFNHTFKVINLTKTDPYISRKCTQKSRKEIWDILITALATIVVQPTFFYQLCIYDHSVSSPLLC